jgi:hypothetical protein
MDGCQLAISVGLARAVRTEKSAKSKRAHSVPSDAGGRIVYPGPMPRERKA